MADAIHSAEWVLSKHCYVGRQVDVLMLDGIRHLARRYLAAVGAPIDGRAMCDADLSPSAPTKGE